MRADYPVRVLASHNSDWWACYFPFLYYAPTRLAMNNRARSLQLYCTMQKNAPPERKLGEAAQTGLVNVTVVSNSWIVLQPGKQDIGQTRQSLIPAKSRKKARHSGRAWRRYFFILIYGVTGYRGESRQESGYGSANRMNIGHWYKKARHRSRASQDGQGC